MMNFLWRMAVNVIDPLGLWRFLLVQPLLIACNVLGLRNPLSPANDSAAHAGGAGAIVSADQRNKAGNGGGGLLSLGGERGRARDVAKRVTMLAMAVGALIWVAVFMYVTFYYTYMPAVEHVHPVRMQFDACNHDISTALAHRPHADCEFPHAFVRLDGGGTGASATQSPMRAGQSYKIHLHIDMPDSPANRELGMFMVCASMRDAQADLLDHSCRSTIMNYRSTWVRRIHTWLLSPLYLFGSRSEQQRLEVELFDAYGLDQRQPVRDVYIELQSRHIQFYTVRLHVVAHFAGLRYAMWNWPLLSACVGIATNLAFILVALALSYYNWAHVLWFERKVRQKLRPRRREREEEEKAAEDDGKVVAVVAKVGDSTAEAETKPSATLVRRRAVSAGDQELADYNSDGERAEGETEEVVVVMAMGDVDDDGLERADSERMLRQRTAKRRGEPVAIVD